MKSKSCNKIKKTVFKMKRKEENTKIGGGKIKKFSQKRVGEKKHLRRGIKKKSKGKREEDSKGEKKSK